ncbi:MAG: glycosyltransferase family 4 protein, partial [Bacteroidota bacterium]
TQTLAEGLAAYGHNVTVVSTWFTGEKEIEKKENLKIIRLKSKRRYTYRSNPREMWSWIVHSKKFLSTYCSEHRFDLCFANFSIPGGETALFLKKRFNIPFIVVSHGHDIPWFFPQQMFWYHLITYYRIRKICRQSEKLVLLSEPMKANADKFMGKHHQHKNVIISNAFDNSLFYPDYSKRNDVFTIVFSGRLVEQKDPMTFLKAMQLLAQHNINFEVEIYGDGVMRRKMENFVGCNNLMEKIHFKGWMKKEELAEAYQKAHVFVSTSLEEGMSVAILEAMASGLYVFGTPVSNNIVMIHENESGEIFTCGTADNLAQKLIEFYKYKFNENYQIPHNTLEKFGDYYHNRVMIQGYTDMFENADLSATKKENIRNRI